MQRDRRAARVPASRASLHMIVSVFDSPEPAQSLGYDSHCKTMKNTSFRFEALWETTYAFE